MIQFITSILIAIVVLLVYFIPAMIAMSRGHKNTLAIFLTNLMLGWILGIGWAVALIWAVTEKPAGEGAVQVAAAAPAAPKTFGDIVKTVGKVFGGLLATLFVIFVILTLLMQRQEMTGGSDKPESARVKTGAPVAADELFK